mmetsp:Transcript_2799/g.7344  ORF Transcript_2799/g.7344 Transcript_2799/m.7344 type:complete len:323 (-) Transcript_2799:1093-2061(-)
MVRAGGRRRSRSDSDPSVSTAVDFVTLSGKKFFLVPSVVVFVQTVSDLVAYSWKVPGLTTEVTHRTIELFKMYNAMSCDLILGAGAMATAGLKSISAKHLAAVAQAISFVKQALPLVEENLAGKLVPLHRNILVPQFRSLARDLDEHHKCIKKKLVKIMQDRLLANLRVLDSMAESWNDDSPSQNPNPQANLETAETAETAAGGANGAAGHGAERPEGGEPAGLKPSQFARTVTKQVDVLKNVLCPLLLREDLESIFGGVASFYADKCLEAFAALPASRQLHCDARAIHDCLGDLPKEHGAWESLAKLEQFCATRQNRRTFV